jgi:nucleotide-binding universal stress UspA family protein
MIRNGGLVAPSVLEYDDRNLNHALAGCEQRFRAALHPLCNSVEWRCATAQPADFLAAEVRAADLLIVGQAEPGSRAGAMGSLDIGDAVMECGRPMLIVPSRMTSLAVNRIFVAWKETAEARRAIAAALPLLQQAQNVMIVELIPDEAEGAQAAKRLSDVARWLLSHRVVANTRVELSSDDDGKQLNFLADDYNSDIILAGAYGHSRLREWVFGGVTRHLLEQTSVCSLLMH